MKPTNWSEEEEARTVILLSRGEGLSAVTCKMLAAKDETIARAYAAYRHERKLLRKRTSYAARLRASDARIIRRDLLAHVSHA